MAWTAADIPDQTGRTAVVTGANSGIGYHQALELARHGAHVVLACRDTGRGAAALSQLTAALPGASADVAALDLADLGSVRRFADSYRAGHAGLDILVNNAGVMALPRRSTADGFELQFGTNHLGHFALTGLLLPHLRDRPGARVVTVSSLLHPFGRIDFGNLNAERRYRKWAAYTQSKLANLLFALELQRRLDAAGAGVVSIAAHPGVAATNLHASGPRLAGNRLRERLAQFGGGLAYQPAPMGALPVLRAATDPTVRGGDYLGPANRFGSRGLPRPATPSRRARDDATARRLWDVSEQLTGVHYDFAAVP
jgi:NAD(P)-dependent dehydrogenase (short-subunit alcohol dehydrogenase family)